MVQANPGTTTSSQPPNSTTVGMNDITPPRMEVEEQEVTKMQHIRHTKIAFIQACIHVQCYFICSQIEPSSVMTTVKEVNPPTCSVGNATATRNLFPTNKSKPSACLNASHEPIRPSAKTRSQKKKLQVLIYLYVNFVCSFKSNYVSHTGNLWTSNLCFVVRITTDLISLPNYVSILD